MTLKTLFSIVVRCLYLTTCFIYRLFTDNSSPYTKSFTKILISKVRILNLERGVTSIGNIIDFIHCLQKFCILCVSEVPFLSVLNTTSPISESLLLCSLTVIKNVLLKGFYTVFVSDSEQN